MNEPAYISSVGLYIVGDDLNPDEVTNVLGVAPTCTRRKGEMRYPKTGRPYAPRTSSWSISADHDSGDIGDQLALLLPKFEGIAPLIHSLQGMERARLAVFLAASEESPGMGTCEFELSSEILQRLGRLGVPVFFEMTVCVETRSGPVKET